MTATGGTMENSVLHKFRGQVRGTVLCPGDEGYDAARAVWNARVDRRPGLILRCAGVADVIRGVQFARQNGMEFSIRGGGHNVAGWAVCEGGLMLDLTPLKGVRVDPIRRIARAQAGCTWGDFDHETQAFEIGR